MKTAAALRAEAQHLRELARNITDPQTLIEIQALVQELERRARERDNGGSLFSSLLPMSGGVHAR